MPEPVVPGFLPSHPAATDSATLRLIWPPVADLGGAADVVGSPSRNSSPDAFSP